jgi:DNA polymerase epsilon subunit 2
MAHIPADSFDALADLIGEYPALARSTHFLLVPGPLDLTPSGAFPRRPLLASAVARLKARIPRMRLGTNPARIRFGGQELVILREDVMARALRNLVGVKPAVRAAELQRYVSARHAAPAHILGLRS